MSGNTNGSVSSFISASPGTTRSLSLRRRKDLEVQLFIEFGDFALCRRHQQFGGHADEDAVVAGGVVTQGVAQLFGHQAGIAGGGQQMLETSEEIFSGGNTGGEAGSDPRAQGDQLLATQLVEEP